MQDAPQTQPVQLTSEGLEELQLELKDLIEVRLPAVIDRVAKAREYGDLSENAEYTSAKEDQTLLEARIEEIENILANSEVVQQTRSSSKVGMGSQVTVSIVGKKSKKTVLSIVGEFESVPGENKISSVSPLGKALMGKKKGDHVKVTAPAGEVEYEIAEIE